MPDQTTAPAQRLDKWLWCARVVKSRTLAAQLIGGGKVRVNRMRVLKPAHLLHEGDVLTLAVRGGVHVLKVVSVAAERRGPAREAGTLYRVVDRIASGGPLNPINET